MVWVETPTNPLLNVVDVAALVTRVAGRGVFVAVDNTFATPVNQRPLELGADAAVHSVTKYLGPHFRCERAGRSDETFIIPHRRICSAIEVKAESPSHEAEPKS